MVLDQNERKVMPEQQSVSWGQMMEQAEAAAPPSYDPPPVGGPYDFQIISSRVAKSSTGKPGIGFTAQVESGPHAKARAGATQWISMESPNAMGIFFRIMNTLGLTREWFSNFMDKPVDDPNTVEQIANAIIGQRFSGRVTEHRKSGDRVYADCSVDGPAKTPAPAGPSGPAAPARPATPAAPVTQVTPPVSAPTPTAAPTPTPAATPSPWDASPPPPPPLGTNAPF